MVKKDIKIGILSSKFINYKFETFLKEEGYENVKTFTDYSKEINDLDILFIEEEFFNRYEDLIENNLIYALLISMIDKNVFLNYIKKGAKSILLKSADKDDFILSLETLISFKNLENEIVKYTKELQKVLLYKDKQEDLALNKQLKIIKDNVSMKYMSNGNIVNSFFKPKDILSGDSYFATNVDGKYFFCIVDSMGKGLSASLTAMLSISFLSYLFETIPYEFDTYISKTIDYIKTILLENEALCIIFVEFNNNNIKFANFSMPPIFMKKDGKIIKLKPNNLPLINTFKTQNINIDEYYEDFDTLAMFSDGLIEKELQNTLLISKFTEYFKRFHFLNDIMKEIKKDIDEFDDDVTVIFIAKDRFEYEKIFDKEYIFHKKDVDDILSEIEALKLKEFNVISIILIELLLNVFEHQVKLDKDKIIKHEKSIDNKKTYVRIKIFLSQKYVKLIIEENKLKPFNISEIFKQERLKKYSGRGILTINFFASAVAYNDHGNRVKIYIRRKDGF